MMLWKLIVCLLLLTSVARASGEDKSLLAPYPQEPLLNEIIAFTPLPHHHFNLKAKTSCGNGYLVSEEEQRVQCQMFAPGTSELQLFVCDDGQTFCRREAIKIKTQEPSSILGWVKYYKETLLNRGAWSTPFKSGVSPNSVARGFAHNELLPEIERARKEKKKLLVYFTQLSCPPCRLMKETSFASDEFQTVIKDYVTAQIDLDVDVAPEKVQPLKVRGTPTMIVFDSDFKEIGRATHIMSPPAFKLFLQSLPETAPAKPFDDEDPTWLAEYEKKSSAKEKIDFIQGLKVEGNDFNTHGWINYMMAFFEPVTMMKLPADQTLFTKAMGMLASLEGKIKSAPIDELQRAFDLNSYYEITSYMYEKKGRASEAKAIKTKQLALLDNFPKLPGVTETNQITVLKAELSEDPQKKKVVYDEMRAKNKDDYTYDFWEASRAMQARDFATALVEVDKSLAVAKDRSWQKAFLMKIDILQALGRKDEASKMISDLLAQMKLPSNTSMKVHQFVQQLRQAQFELN